jgi:hypothetical protein
MQTYAQALSLGHTQTELCRDLCAWKQQHAAARDFQLAPKMRFTMYGEELKLVLVFKYLGRLLACNNNYIQAMQSNLKKAWK